MEQDRNNSNNGRRQSLARFILFLKRRIKLNRFFLVIDTKKGVVISAITIIIVDLIDLLWNLSMTFGPLNSTMTTLLLIETFLVICVSFVLLYAMKTENKSDLRSILFTWLVVVAMDYILRASMTFSSLIISEKIQEEDIKIAIEHKSMANLFNYIVFDLWHELGDPEAENYFWLKGPWLTWLATIAYLYIVLKAGPDFMRNRKPYEMKLAIRLYNLLLVIINTYLFVGSVQSFRYGLDFWGCGEALSLRKRTPMLHYGHLFFHTRYLEFFDTFFFVLRKKNSHISFLHVFHHGVVPTLMYIGLKFYPMPFNALLPTTNMFVHIIMYAYYGLATFGPGIQKYLWWKRYLTTLQISQFALLLVHCSQPLLFYNSPECNFPPGLVFINSCIGLTFLLLFVSFYRKTYCSSRSASMKGKISSDPLPTNGVKKQYDAIIGATCKIDQAFNEASTIKDKHV